MDSSKGQHMQLSFTGLIRFKFEYLTPVAYNCCYGAQKSMLYAQFLNFSMWDNWLLSQNIDDTRRALCTAATKYDERYKQMWSTTHHSTTDKFIFIYEHELPL